MMSSQQISSSPNGQSQSYSYSSSSSSSFSNQGINNPFNNMFGNNMFVKHEPNDNMFLRNLIPVDEDFDFNQIQNNKWKKNQINSINDEVKNQMSPNQLKSRRFTQREYLPNGNIMDTQQTTQEESSKEWREGVQRLRGITF